MQRMLGVFDALPSASRLSLADVARLLLPAWQGELDRLVRDERAAGHVTTCRVGCAACCRHPVPLSMPEAFMLKELVDALPGDRRSAVLAGFEASRARLAAAGLAGAALLSGANEYRASSIDCPFLAGERCTIHAVRPGACREHLALSDPARCLLLGDHAELMAFPQRLGDLLAALAARLLGGPLVQMPLVNGLDWCAGAQRDARRTWTVAVLRRHSAVVFGLEADAHVEGSRYTPAS